MKHELVPGDKSNCTESFWTRRYRSVWSTETAVSEAAIHEMIAAPASAVPLRVLSRLARVADPIHLFAAFRGARHTRDLL
jgi:hypothetical protein